jgi:hypothetical protein
MVCQLPNCQIITLPNSFNSELRTLAHSELEKCKVKMQIGRETTVNGLSIAELPNYHIAKFFQLRTLAHSALEKCKLNMKV